ncbi:MAG: hypothetical protein H6807_14045 [Planctomycetes bacterium]|nr:hypothetical protein [Planctomycetota bacterium]
MARPSDPGSVGLPGAHSRVYHLPLVGEDDTGSGGEGVKIPGYDIEIDGRVLLSRTLSAEAIHLYAIAITFQAQRAGPSCRLDELLASQMLDLKKNAFQETAKELHDVGVIDIRVYLENWAIEPVPLNDEAVKKLRPKEPAPTQTISFLPFFARCLMSQDAWLVAVIALAVKTMGRALAIGELVPWFPGLNEFTLMLWLDELRSLDLIDAQGSPGSETYRAREISQDQIDDLQVCEYLTSELGWEHPEPKDELRRRLGRNAHGSEPRCRACYPKPVFGDTSFDDDTDAHESLVTSKLGIDASEYQALAQELQRGFSAPKGRKHENPPPRGLKVGDFLRMLSPEEPTGSAFARWLGISKQSACDHVTELVLAGKRLTYRELLKVHVDRAARHLGSLGTWG